MSQGSSMLLLGMAPALVAAPAVREALDDRATLRAALAFEVALARAEARCGVIPADAAAAIARAAAPDRYDLSALAAGAERAGTLAIPLVKALTAEVARADPEAAGYVHFGATSQDVADTGLVLQLRNALATVRNDGATLVAALRRLAAAHADTPMLGRTLLQPAPPVAFGLKAAGWLDALARNLARLDAAAEDALVLQFGGAVGTLAALGDKGSAVAAALGDELGLPVPTVPWHTARDRVVAFGAALAILTGVLGKIARDVSLLMQAEVAEAFEPGGEGRGGSSTMPHKRNPTASMIALAAAGRAPGLLAGLAAGLVQEHERALGGWQAEAAALADLVLGASGALRAMNEAIGGLKVDPAAMRTNIGRLKGLVFAERLMLALAPRLGRDKAHRLAEELAAAAAASGRELLDVAAENAAVTGALDPARLASLFVPEGYLGSTSAFIAGVLDATRPSDP